MSERRSIQRLLTLRQFPGFADAELSELASIAENLIETTYEAGTVVAGPPGRLDAIHLVVDGRLHSAQIEWGANQLFGAFEVIAGRGVPSPVIAAVTTRTLQLPASDFAEILEDSHGVLTSARRALARRLLSLARGTYESPTPISIETSPATALGLVDRLILLRQQIPFTTARIQALAALAQATEEAHWPAGAEIVTEGELANGALMILEGAVQITSTRRGRRVVGPGASFGWLETLGEVPFEHRAEAITPVRALRCPRVAIFDVMEDHTDFAVGLVSKLASALLDVAAMPSPVGLANDVN